MSEERAYLRALVERVERYIQLEANPFTNRNELYEKRKEMRAFLITLKTELEMEK